MAKQGNKTAIFKLAGIIVGVVVCVWWVGGWVLSSKKGGDGGKV